MLSCQGRQNKNESIRIAISLETVVIYRHEPNDILFLVLHGFYGKKF